MSVQTFSSNQVVSAKHTKGAGLDRLLAIWNRRKWLAIVAFAAPLTIGLTAMNAMPSLYKASATVLVDRQQVPEMFVTPTVTSALETRLQTISQETLSRSRLEALISQFNLYPEPRKRMFPEEVVERMRRDIALEVKGVDVRGQRHATVAFTIGYLGLVPETVAQVTNRLASLYIEENQKVRERQAAGTAEFLRVQLRDTKDRLDAQERRVSEFKGRHLGELPQQMDANLSTLDRLHMQLRLNADGQARQAERRASLAAQLAEAEASSTNAGTIAGSGTPDSRVARLEQLQQTLRELRNRYSDKYPDVTDVQADIATLTRELAEEKAKDQPKIEKGTPASPQVVRLREALSLVDSEINGLRSEDKHLKEMIAAYQRRVEQSPRREQEFKELARDYETTREFYQTLLKKYEEASIAENMEQRRQGEQFRIIEPAIPPARPMTNPLRLILITIVGAAGLAIGAVVAAEHLDTSFHTADELRAHTSVPLLVTIPPIVTDDERHRGVLRFWLAATATTVAIFGLAVGAYFVAHDNEQLVRLLSRGSA
jgi:polysaccharide biosynthesis transport protein